MTMRALETLSADPRGSMGSGDMDMGRPQGRSYLNSGATTSWPKSTASFSASRMVTLSPLSTGRGRAGDGDGRATHLPSPGINTPNPFSATSPEFPKPSYNRSSVRHPNFTLSNRSTEEYARLDSACTSHFPFPEERSMLYDDRKGKHVLGLVPNSAEGFDGRSGRERDESAQGLVRDSVGDGGGRGKEEKKKKKKEGIVLWVGLQRWTWRGWKGGLLV